MVAASCVRLVRRGVLRVAAAFALCLAAAGWAFAFDAASVISPCPGTWANMQPLVLDVSDVSEAYYSLTGSDPLVSGFAYDGPVLIDERGSVTVTIAALMPDGSRADCAVSYDVVVPDAAFSDPDESLFIQVISENPIRRYASGSPLAIPGRFAWGMGNPARIRYAGTTLSVSPRNAFDRYVPCTVTDGTWLWRFVLHVVPGGGSVGFEETGSVGIGSAETGSARAENSVGAGDDAGGVPFVLEDWGTFRFTGSRLIYRIDDEYWTASMQPVTLDRSVPHTIRWQSMEYEFGNPVYSAVVPQSPEFSVVTNADGSWELSVPHGSQWTLGAPRATHGGIALGGGQRTSVVADTFVDDSFFATLSAGAYYGGVYQGDVTAQVAVDKRAPDAPVITSTTQEGASRTTVTLSFAAEPGARVFYAVGGPLESEGGFSAGDALFDSVMAGGFVPVPEDGQVRLYASPRVATFYKVLAYCVDAAGNQSGTTEFRVVLDGANYYLAPAGFAGGSEGADGSYARPFTSLEGALTALRGRPFVRLHLMGDMALGHGDTVIDVPCVLTAQGATVSLPPDGRIVVRGADFSAEGCSFEKRVASSGALVPEAASGTEVFLVERGSLALTGCEVVSLFSSGGIAVNATGSDVSLEGSGITVTGEVYACALAAFDSAVRVASCRVTSAAQTCVDLSVFGGSLSLERSACTVIGHLGRCVELAGSSARLTGNSFSGQLDADSRQCEAVWADVDSTVVRSGNEQGGF